MAVDDAYKARAGGRNWLMSPRAMAVSGIFLAAATGYYVFYKDKRNAREGHATVGNGVTAHDPPSDVRNRK
ncbi:hypothetical protein NL676_034268 [Syzygium grande]|nr:hypothetical protein NL676_034262 [Syzygium grande]KAI6680387.1 hypothetical protein NL676_034268 [Syzygium grande]